MDVFLSELRRLASLAGFNDDICYALRLWLVFRVTCQHNCMLHQTFLRWHSARHSMWRARALISEQVRDEKPGGQLCTAAAIGGGRQTDEQKERRVEGGHPDTT